MIMTKLFRILSVALVALGCMAGASAQDIAPSTQGSGNDAAVSGDSSSPAISGANSFWGGGLGTYGLPDMFARHLIANFSIGQNRDNGILNGRIGSSGISSLSFTDIASEVAYDYRQRRSDYAIQYRANGRHYAQYSQLDVLGHDLGLSQSLTISRRVNWVLNHRFSMTPDLAGSLMAETLANQLGFINPLPSVAVFGGGNAQSGFMNPLPPGATVIAHGFQPATSPSEGFITLRSMRISNFSDAKLSFNRSPQTQLSLNMGLSRLRYQDKNLFGTNQYKVNASMSQVLTSRTTVTLGFQGTRLDLSSVLQQTTHAGLRAGFTRQLSRRNVFSAEFGLGDTIVEAQQTIPLPTLLSNLLGRNTLVRKAARSNIGWLGAATFATNVHDTGIHIRYDRDISDSGGLGGASLTQKGSVDVSRRLGQRTNLVASLSYHHLMMLGLQNPLAIDQQGLSVSITRQLNRNMDFSTSFNYAKSTRGGLRGPVLLDHNLVAIRLTYFFHRLGPAEAGIF